MFKYINSKPNGIVFADTANPESKFSMATERSYYKSNGIQKPIVRTNTLITHSDSIRPADCTDGCSPMGIFPRSTRIVTSGITTKASDVINDLKFMIGILETNPTYFEGFNLSQTAELEYPVQPEA